MNRCIAFCVTVPLFAATAPVAAASFSTFASFTTLPGGAFYWQNDGDPGVGGNGNGGTLMTTTTPVSPATPNAIPVSFTWAAAGLFNQSATAVFQATAVNSPAGYQFIGPGAQLIQTNINNGSFAIYGLGQILMTGSFASGFMQSVTGQPYAYLVTDSYAPRLLTFASTYSAIPGGPKTLVITKLNLPAPYVTFTPGKAWNSFDPDALVEFQSFVPEPGNWAMLISGFGLVGATLRRRRGQPA